ncbi:MAG: prolipoprotein diacylglyceryl transferase [Candidatus Nanopelagicales bacterium]
MNSVTALASFIPSPGQGVWYLGPVPLRAYALMILLGIVVGVVITERRWVARGGTKGQILDIALWAVPFGIIGARLYHVATDWYRYFGPEGQGLVAALKIWSGGLGIWGAVAGGALGAWIAARRMGLLVPPLADAVAPGIAVAQAIGRFGNYFNQELFGRPTTVPWALQIDPVHRPVGYEEYATFHPTFLYESLWCLAVAGIVIWADKRFRLGHGRVFALYVALYCLGRLGVELVRIDSATQVGGLRINVWTSVLIGLAGVVYFIVVGRRHPTRETDLYRPGRGPTPEPGEAAEQATSSDSAVDTDVDADGPEAPPPPVR